MGSSLCYWEEPSGGFVPRGRSCDAILIDEGRSKVVRVGMPSFRWEGVAGTFQNWRNNKLNRLLARRKATVVCGLESSRIGVCKVGRDQRETRKPKISVKVGVALPRANINVLLVNRSRGTYRKVFETATQRDTCSLAQFYGHSPRLPEQHNTNIESNTNYYLQLKSTALQGLCLSQPARFTQNPETPSLAKLKPNLIKSDLIITS